MLTEVWKLKNCGRQSPKIYPPQDCGPWYAYFPSYSSNYSHEYAMKGFYRPIKVLNQFTLRYREIIQKVVTESQTGYLMDRSYSTDWLHGSR